MSSEESVSNDPRTISQFAFYCLVFGTWTLGSITESTLVWMTVRHFEWTIDRIWVNGLIQGSIFLNLALTLTVVDRILKWFGWSRSGKTLEVRERLLPLPEGEDARDEFVEARIPASFRWSLAVVCLAICVGGILILNYAPQARFKGFWSAYVLMSFFGLGATWFFYQLRWGKPQARANSSGIWALPVGFHLRARFVPWSKVASCEIETYYNTLGKPVLTKPTLKGIDGKPLLIANLTSVHFVEQERLIKFIRAKLPKQELDLMEW